MSSGGSSERLCVYGETAFEHLMLNSTGKHCQKLAVFSFIKNFLKNILKFA